MAWPRPRGVAKAAGAWPSSWGRGQSLGGMDKVMGVRPRPWGRGQGRGGVDKA